MSNHLETLREFRQAIYTSFPARRDSLLDLLDAFSSNDRARSTVELSLNSCFRRQYSALYKAIAAASLESDYPVCSLEAYRQGAALLNTLPPRPNCRIRYLAWMKRRTNDYLPVASATVNISIARPQWQPNVR
jgi:hypothetical protein